jgi:hypothetical protein
MVSRYQKLRMRQFIADRIEGSARYDILESEFDHLLILQKPDLVENPRHAHIFLHNVKRNIDEYVAQCRANDTRGTYNSNVFYKDYETFFVRLGGRAHFKGDARSLKHYSDDDINKMIHLRGLEKAALERQQPDDSLIYFQPETDRLEESIRVFSMESVNLDYSHIGPGDPGYGFVRNRPSIDYKIAEEMCRITASEGGVGFTLARGNVLLLGKGDAEK